MLGLKRLHNLVVCTSVLGAALTVRSLAIVEGHGRDVDLRACTVRGERMASMVPVPGIEHHWQSASDSHPRHRRVIFVSPR